MASAFSGPPWLAPAARGRAGALGAMGTIASPHFPSPLGPVHPLAPCPVPKPGREGVCRMKALLLILALAVGLATAPAASAAPADDVRELYGRFLEAQNARDLARVRAVLLDSPKFLWVSDGMSVWGPDALVERMSSFQKAEVWRVEPDLAAAVAVEVGDDAAYLHLPLALEIGAAANANRLSFLVSVLGVETGEGWRIAALFTTTEKPR
jgi:ketosteroid isomerase-like protein